MINTISFWTKFGWISASEENDKISCISFGKSKNKGRSLSLLRFKKNIENYLQKKNKNLDINILLCGSDLQKKYGKN